MRSGASPQLWATSIGATAPGRARVVLLHGFTQTATSWRPLAEPLVAGRSIEVIAFDMPGHGRSSSVAADLEQTADLVAVAGRATYVGYSMGARIALHLAIRHPHLVERLVLIGGTGGLDSEEERETRRAADEELAKRVLDEGTPAFVNSWLNGPLFRSLQATPDDVEARNTNPAEGLAMSLRLSGTGTQRPLWDELSALSIPSLVIAGSNDTKFTALGRRLVESLGPAARFVSIPDAGHAAHLERPDVVLDELQRFLDESLGTTHRTERAAP